MKYEMIFGDEGLFFDAQKDCEMVGNGHHKVENGKLMVWNFSEKYWSESHTDKITIQAMRRIIKEPVAPVWTKKDRESETLPELGSLIVGESSGVVYEVIKVTKAGVVIFADTPDDVVGYYDKRDILLFFKPIETPAEKAQREEDEFVVAMLDAASQEQLMSAGFKSGVIAAYRKMKGGE